MEDVLEHLRTVENLAKKQISNEQKDSEAGSRGNKCICTSQGRYNSVDTRGMGVRVRASVGSRSGHELEQLEWLHKRGVSTWDWEEEVTDLLSQVYFWYVSLLGPLTCLQKTLYLPKPSMQTEGSSLPWEHRTVWGQHDFQCNRNCFHSIRQAELYLVTSSTFAGAIWVTQTLWSHVSLRSFYLSDQGMIHCLSQEEWWCLIHHTSPQRI